MSRFPFSDPRTLPVNVIGALDFDERKGALAPRRLPAWTRPQVPQMMDVMVRMPSGVRLAFRTDSPAVTLTVNSTRMVTPPAAPRPVVFDLVANGRLMSHACDAGSALLLNPAKPGEFELQRGEPYDVTFELGVGEKECELWLPQNCFIELHALCVEDGAQLEAYEPGGPAWAHYGSSISHCMEADQPTGTWPAVAARRSGARLQSFGVGGQCHLDPFVARTIRDLAPDCISIKVGINVVNLDSMRERVFQPLLHGFVDTLRERCPNTPILLVSPIFCPSAETNPGPTRPDGNGQFRTFERAPEFADGALTLQRIRTLLEETVDARSDPNLHYLDGLRLFGADDAGDLPDALHPNPAGYRRMGERFSSLVFGPGGAFHELTPDVTGEGHP